MPEEERFLYESNAFDDKERIKREVEKVKMKLGPPVFDDMQYQATVRASRAEGEANETSSHAVHVLLQGADGAFARAERRHEKWGVLRGRFGIRGDQQETVRYLEESSGRGEATVHREITIGARNDQSRD